MRRQDLSDIDFEQVWIDIAAHLPDVAPATRTRRRTMSGPAVALAAFVVVLAAGFALAALRPGGGHPESNAAAVVNERSPSELPTAVLDRESFEMIWRLDDGSTGRVIWQDEMHWRVDRIDLTTGVPVMVYAEGREGSNRFASYPGSDDLEGWSAVQDASVPYKMLLKAHSVADAWAQLGGGDATVIPPTHGAATIAVTDGDLTVEFDEFGLPLVVHAAEGRFGGMRFEVTSLDYRPIHREEFQAPDLSVMYAAHLLTDTSEEQRRILEDGVVTLAEYSSAVAAGFACSGSQQDPAFDVDTGLYQPLDDAACRQTHLDDVEEVWRTQARYLDEDEFAELWYMIEGRDDLAAMLDALPGEQITLGAGDGWRINVQERGDGYCFGFWTSDGGSEGCELPSYWNVPNVVSASWAVHFSEPVTGEVFGFVSTDAASIRLHFTTGEPIDLAPVGGDTGFAVLGYAHLWSVSGDGILRAVEVFDGDGELVGEFDVLGDRCSSTSFLDGASLPAAILSDVDAAFVEACGSGG